MQMLQPSQASIAAAAAGGPGMASQPKNPPTQEPPFLHAHCRASPVHARTHLAGCAFSFRALPKMPRALLVLPEPASSDAHAWNSSALESATC